MRRNERDPVPASTVNPVIRLQDNETEFPRLPKRRGEATAGPSEAFVFRKLKATPPAAPNRPPRFLIRDGLQTVNCAVPVALVRNGVETMIASSSPL